MLKEETGRRVISAIAHLLEDNLPVPENSKWVEK